MLKALFAWFDWSAFLPLSNFAIRVKLSQTGRQSNSDICE